MTCKYCEKTTASNCNNCFGESFVGTAIMQEPVKSNLSAQGSCRHCLECLNVGVAIPGIYMVANPPKTCSDYYNSK